MKIQTLYLGTALSVVLAASLVLAPNANATIIGSTYDFNVSSTGSTQITSSGIGTHTDPANPGFCLGPPTACGSGAGISGSFTFGHVSPTQDTITFGFYGSTTSGLNGSFSIDLGNFVTTDGEAINGVTYASGNLANGNFTSVSWNGTDAVFTGTPNGNYSALGGRYVTFDVAVPEPSSLALFGTALLGLAGFEAIRRRRKHGRKPDAFGMDNATPA